MDLLTPPATPAAAPATTPAQPTQTPPAPATPPAAASPFTNELPPNWYSQLGDEWTAHADTLNRFNTVADLAKSMLHFRKTGPAYPDENATTEDIARFRAAAKVPETPDGYTLKPEKLPDNVTWDDNTAKQFAEIAHKHNVPAPAMQALMQAQIEIEANRAQSLLAQQEAETEAARAEMVAVLGKDPFEFQKNAGMINHMIQTLATQAGITPDSPHLQALGRNPDAMKLMFQVVKMTSEDNFRRPTSFGDLRTPAQKASDIMTGKDPEWSQKYKEGDPEAINLVVLLGSQQ